MKVYSFVIDEVKKYNAIKGRQIFITAQNLNTASRLAVTGAFKGYEVQIAAEQVEGETFKVVYKKPTEEEIDAQVDKLVDEMMGNIAEDALNNLEKDVPASNVVEGANA